MKLRQRLLIAFGLSLAFVLVAVLSGVAYGLLGLLVTLVIGPDVFDAWMVLAALFFAWHFLPERFKALHREYEIRGHAMIDAPISQVWDAVLPRPGRPYQADTFVDVTTVPGSPQRLDLHPDPDQNGLNLPPLQAVLEEVQPEAYLRMTFLNVEAYPLWAGDLQSSEYFLEEIEGQVRLTQIETLNKLRLSTVLSLFLLNPCRDSVRRTKALCEGVDDPSWMSWMARNIEGEQRTFGVGTVGSIGLLMCAFVTLFAVGLMYALLYMI